MYESARLVKKSTEVLGPSTPGQKLSWMLALLRAHRDGRPKVSCRSCLAWNKLFDFYDVDVLKWSDIEGFRRLLSSLMTDIYKENEKDLQNCDDLSSARKDSGVFRLRELAAAWRPAHSKNLSSCCSHGVRSTACRPSGRCA